MSTSDVARVRLPGWLDRRSIVGILRYWWKSHLGGICGTMSQRCQRSAASIYLSTYLSPSYIYMIHVDKRNDVSVLIVIEGHADLIE